MGGSALATRENETAMLEMFIEGFSEIPVTILVSTVNTSTGVPGNAYSLCVTDSSIFCTYTLQLRTWALAFITNKLSEGHPSFLSVGFFLNVHVYTYPEHYLF